MTRQHVTFTCEVFQLVGTIDKAAGKTGLLLLTGGNETRAGAFSGQAELAARIASAGFPTFRFDRRGVGDSEGENSGFRGSAADIAAAIACFRENCPDVTAIVGFGNCDAASALMLASGAGCDSLVLANPWTIEQDDASPPPDAVRARYAAKLRNPRELLRLLTGGVNLRKLAGGIARALGPAPQPSSLARDMARGLAGFGGSTAILLAARDRTAQAFEATWDANDTRVERCEGASHAFVEPQARDWLVQRLTAILQSM